MDMSDLSQIPAALPPDGQTSNFINPRDITDIPMVALCVLLPLMFVFVLLRIGARVRLIHALWADDSMLYSCKTASFSLASKFRTWSANESPVLCIIASVSALNSASNKPLALSN